MAGADNSCAGHALVSTSSCRPSTTTRLPVPLLLSMNLQHMQEIQRPTVLAGEVKCLISLIHRIAPLMALHASVLVREALLRCTCTDKQPVSQQASQQDAQLPSRPGSQQSNWSDRQQTGRQDGTQKVQQPTAPPVPVISSIAEWYMSMVVKDHRNIGVSISKARCAVVHEELLCWPRDNTAQQGLLEFAMPMLSSLNAGQQIDC